MKEKLDGLRTQGRGGPEKRVMEANVEYRQTEEGELRGVAGLGIVYNKWTELFPGFKERILPGAAKANGVVKSYFNHDPSKVLSTTRSKPPLEVEERKDGVYYYSPIPPTTYGKDLEINLERGNVEGSSFSFQVPDDGDAWWEDEGVTYREIKKLTYGELGPVTDPAYLETEAELHAKRVYNEYRTRLQGEREAEEARKKAEEEEKRQELERQEQALFLMERHVETLEKEMI